MNEVLKKLECENCHQILPIGSKIYICPPCQKYKCEKHFQQYNTCANTRNAKEKHTMQLDSNLTEAFSSIEKFISKLNFKLPERSEPEKSFSCSHSENGCKEEFLAQKAHEMACIYQKVSCPKLDCKELVIFKDMDIHLDQAHKIQKSKEEWDFEGNKDELVKNICSLTKYNQQFFPLMYIKDDYLYFKVIMLGHQENVMYSKACFTFYRDNGQQIYKENDVYPITEKDEEYQFSIESLKNLTEYYDLKSMEKKQQEKIQFNLKITNAKLDEIAKDKAIVIESRDSDG